MIKRGPEPPTTPDVSSSDPRTGIQLENSQVTLSRASISRNEEAHLGEAVRMKSIHLVW